VDPFTATGTAITRCFNSQASGATVNTAPCGFSIFHLGQGIDLVDFGFQISDLFLSATVFSGGSIVTCVQDAHTPCIAGTVTATVNQTITDTFDPTSNTRVDVPFWIIVF